MIKSKYTTLKVLSLRYNFIDNPAGIELKEALETNKTITRMPLDYNSIKITVLESIQKLCQRNLHLDKVNEKTKNIRLIKDKERAKTQRQALNIEIQKLKDETDKSIEDAQLTLNQLERFKHQRKSMPQSMSCGI
jgi:predicted  nucleic acid-binding Zn-ribbon protein